MSLFDFLLFRNKKTSVLGAKQYGKHEIVEPKETSVLSSMQYGKDIDILISRQEDYDKVMVADYYTINQYVEKMREIDQYGIENMLNNSVVWNSGKQRVNKGNYFVFRHNNNLYNILVNDEQIRIDERIPIGEETLNRVITFYSNQEYQYFRCIHDKNGSSRACRYYKPNDDSPMHELPKEEFLQDFNSTMNSLKTFKAIDEIVDMAKLDEYVFVKLDAYLFDKKDDKMI